MLHEVGRAGRFAAVLLLLLTAAAAPDPAVYTCRVFVTGTGLANRPGALRDCVEQVLVKLSGQSVPAGTMADGGLVRDFLYLDLMSDLPLHDEQGTRDRPFELIGHVDPVGVETVLRAAGVSAWTAPRPTLLVRVAVTDRNGNRFELTGDGPGERQRRALLDASERFALPVALPVEVPGSLPNPGTADVSSQPTLAGELRWSDADFGWNASWRLLDAGDAWTVTGVSFDAAFRAGVGGAAQWFARRGP